MTDVIAMAMTCSRCERTVTNDSADIKHPLEFIQALRDRGWRIIAKGHAHDSDHRCPECVNL